MWHGPRHPSKQPNPTQPEFRPRNTIVTYYVAMVVRRIVRGTITNCTRATVVSSSSAPWGRSDRSLTSIGLRRCRARSSPSSKKEGVDNFHSLRTTTCAWLPRQLTKSPCDDEGHQSSTATASTASTATQAPRTVAPFHAAAVSSYACSKDSLQAVYLGMSSLETSLPNSTGCFSQSSNFCSTPHFSPQLPSTA